MTVGKLREKLPVIVTVREKRVFRVTLDSQELASVIEEVTSTPEPEKESKVESNVPTTPKKTRQIFSKTMGRMVEVPW